MALFNIVLDVPSLDGIEDWLEDSINMWGTTVAEGSRVVEISIIEEVEG